MMSSQPLGLKDPEEYFASMTTEIACDHSLTKYVCVAMTSSTARWMSLDWYISSQARSNFWPFVGGHWKKKGIDPKIMRDHLIG